MKFELEEFDWPVVSALVPFGLAAFVVLIMWLTT